MSAIDLVNLILKYVFDGNSSSLWWQMLLKIVISYKNCQTLFQSILNWFLSEWVVVVNVGGLENGKESSTN